MLRYEWSYNEEGYLTRNQTSLACICLSKWDSCNSLAWWSSTQVSRIHSALAVNTPTVPVALYLLSWFPSGSMLWTRWWQGSGSTSTSCWALSCSISLRGPSMQRYWRITPTHPCPRSTGAHTCSGFLVCSPRGGGGGGLSEWGGSEVASGLELLTNISVWISGD